MGPVPASRSRPTTCAAATCGSKAAQAPRPPAPYQQGREALIEAAPHLGDKVDQVAKLAAILVGLQQEEVQARAVVPPLQLKLVSVPHRVSLDVALRP
jgi:hypothetical protein